MNLKYKSKYNVGDYVILEKVFDPTGHGSMKKLDHPIVVEIKKVNATSTGYCYMLQSENNISLGGVMYWEPEIKGKISIPTDEELMWKMWGDK